MPRLSAFYGIVIYMYIRDHGAPHFHARYGNDEVVVEVVSGKFLGGSLPTRQTRQVLEWLDLHRSEVQAAWQLANSGEPPGTIDPLP